jgi:hypothetical protein
MKEMTSIAISKKTREQLLELGRKGQTFDEIIQELLKSQEFV